VVAGEPYRQYVVAHILRPLGMDNSGFDPAAAGERLATGYGAEAGGTRRKNAGYDIGEMAPAGQLFSSVDDMAKFVELQFRSAPAGGAPVLSSESLREMRRPNTHVSASGDAPEFCYGLGVYLDERFGHAGFGHDGAGIGYRSRVWMVPDLKLGIIVLTNQDGADAVVRQIRDLIRGTLTPVLSTTLGQ